ncbi:hypothetical protein SAMN05444422_107187 [Halobiforma haloterrestris]|uniref:Uncharacterized protein n=1 Tax=Natronobacterium haloterrestre TaxID=148448 RepID=A0A1I1II45_NATHA|nr:hypothetical protein [Halobiforma haloterrestris]SFC35936.1 hypothetical protein SAMN05444422_107187 [Halobiforma haloterrestris]
MPDSQHVPSRPGIVRRTARQAWRNLLNVYYTNTTVWRYLKSGALVWFGLMLWAFSNLLLSYRPDLTVMYYTMAYGFVLILWGPLTHFVVVPLVIRLRRSGATGVTGTIARHGSKINLAVFLALVILLGSLPFGPMVLDFQPSSTDGTQSVAPPELECSKTDELVTCSISHEEGYDRVVVSDADGEITTVDEPPYEFEIDAAGHDQFVVELVDEDGEMVDRRVKRIGSIPSESESG